ncbi:MAG: hypothetical protein WB974_19575, partial [Acidobacteriaceae bacterium]
LTTNGEAIYGTERGNFPSFGNYDNFSRRGNTLYIHVYFWPGKTPAAQWLSFFRPATVVAVGGVQGRALSARLLKTGQKLAFRQDAYSLQITGLPVEPPDDPVTVIAVECDREPGVDHHAIRALWPRYKVDVTA